MLIEEATLRNEIKRVDQPQALEGAILAEKDGPDEQNKHLGLQRGE